MACWVGAQGQVNSAIKAKTYPNYDVPPKKKFFLIWTRRLPKSVKGLNSSIAQSAG